MARRLLAMIMTTTRPLHRNDSMTMGSGGHPTAKEFSEVDAVN